jgi:hypothetical protein
MCATKYQNAKLKETKAKEVKQNNTQEFNFLRLYQALIPIEKLK